MTLNKLNTLKEKLMHPNDWDEAIGYFLDHFTKSEELFLRSEKVKIDMIEKLMGETCVQIFRRSPVPLIGLSVFRIKEFGLLHASCIAEGNNILLIYLTDLHKGVFGIFDFAGRLHHRYPHFRPAPRMVDPGKTLWRPV